VLRDVNAIMVARPTAKPEGACCCRLWLRLICLKTPKLFPFAKRRRAFRWNLKTTSIEHPVHRKVDLCAAVPRLTGFCGRA
jgi:hypothetical protein